MSKVWAISTSALPAAACKTIWACWTKRAARVRLRAKRAKSSCGSVVNHTLGALGMLAGRRAATAWSEGEGAGKGVGREIETGDKLPFAPPKTVGGRAGG